MTSRTPNIVRFTRWFDGEPRLIYGGTLDDPAHKDRQSLRVAMHDARQFVRVYMPHEMAQVQAIFRPGHGPMLLAAVREVGKPTSLPTTLVGLGGNLKRLWAYSPPDVLQTDFAVLYDQSGPSGAVIAPFDPDALVAVDLHGEEAWRLPDHFTTYSLRTHRALPGLVLSVGGSVTLVRHDADSAASTKIASQSEFHASAHDGLLFPDQEGDPTMVMCGLDHADDALVLYRVNGDGSVLWRANLPDKVRCLAMIEPAAGQRVIFAASDSGVLYALDEDGVLLGRVQVPRPRSGPGMRTLSLAAGRLGPGRWAVAVRHWHGAYLYKLDLGALGSSTSLGDAGAASQALPGEASGK